MTSISGSYEIHLISLLQGLESYEVKHLLNVTLPKIVKLVLDTPKICTQVRHTKSYGVLHIGWDRHSGFGAEIDQ